MFKNTYFDEHLLTAASENTRKQMEKQLCWSFRPEVMQPFKEETLTQVFYCDIFTDFKSTLPKIAHLKAPFLFN